MITNGGQIFNSLKRYLSLVHHIDLKEIQYYPCHDNPSLFIAAFNRIVKELESRKDKLRSTVVFIDPAIFMADKVSAFPTPASLDPLNNGTDAVQLLSLLILATPEIHWVFLPPVNLFEKTEEHINQTFYSCDINKLATLIKSAIDFANMDLISLFDPCSLRNRIRKNIAVKENGVPVRNDVSAAIDEEISYALLNGYTAYRFGYIAWPITTLKIMQHVFAESDTSLELEHLPTLVFEDLYLNFPDKDGDYHISNLDFRDEEFKKLKNVVDRILVTVGHRKNPKSKLTWLRNKVYLKYTFAGKTKTLFKPFSGIFDLWKKSRKWYFIKNKPIKGKGYIWPPTRPSETQNEELTHSAPGRLLLVAQTLLKRADSILSTASSVEDAIQAATLALEAKELLACKTPTIAMHALSLQHQAEVEAECMFYGVEYDFDVKSRILDIKKEIKAISSWFHSSAKKRSRLNTEIAILTKLASRYQHYGEFDEENLCLNEARKLGIWLWASRGPARWILLPIRFYVNFLLKSLSRFFLVIAGWIAIFTKLYLWQLQLLTPNAKSLLLKSFFLSSQTFIAFQPPDMSYILNNMSKSEDRNTLIILFIIASVLGFIHLGIFISHLYLMLSKKSGG